MDNSQKFAQLGIAVALLGGVITFIGLFPSVIGLEASAGVGVLQMLTILVGFSILISGAYIFVQATYYPNKRHNLAQKVGVRLSMTGVVLATAIGLADVLGFGSNSPLIGQRPTLGPWQTAGLIGSFMVASLGLLIFALFGDGTPDEPSDPDDTLTF
ncbi:MAG: hypothetical protein RML95_03340 [Anaerolineae bacterium]|nr:hypothetical protein [Anaerolineae bacterium]MDW8298350.1 hypothetical protein [Anaerolineae bacterium]